MIGAAAVLTLVAMMPDGAFARGGRGGGGFSGGGFRGGNFAGGGAARFAAPAARFAVAPNVARFAGVAGGGQRGWRNNGWRRGLGYGGVALGLAGAGYYNGYNYPYNNGYYDDYAYGDGYYNGYGDNSGYYVQEQDQDASCYQRRRVHTRYGWRLRNVYVCG